MLNKIIKKTLALLRLVGLDFNKLKSFVIGIIPYLLDFYKFKRQGNGASEFPFGTPCPVLSDSSDGAGVSSGHYFHQDLLVARKIYINSPDKHVDIGSRIDGFVAHVATFRNIEVFDIRPQENKIKNILFKKIDLTDIRPDFFNYCDSISSLHVVEHIGLGRYGDKLDYNGHVKAIDNIYKILKVGGRFYFSVPIGKQRIEFNAHRVFGLKYLLKLFQSKFIIQNFSYVDDAGDLFENVDVNNFLENDCNCIYGCGIFEMIKI